VKKNGSFVNPVAAHRAMPPAEPLPMWQRSSFIAARDAAFSALDLR
jgi:hypothetical protein